VSTPRPSAVRNFNTFTGLRHGSQVFGLGTTLATSKGSGPRRVWRVAGPHSGAEAASNGEAEERDEEWSGQASQSPP
jgi:hypothetical protein